MVEIQQICLHYFVKVRLRTELCKHFHYMQVSGLSEWLGQQFLVLKDFSPEAMALMIAIVVAAFTEITSNTSTASIFLPILAALVCVTFFSTVIFISQVQHCID